MAMSVIMGVPMASASSVTVSVSGSSVLEDENADEIDKEPQDRNYEQSLMLDLGRLHKSFDGLGEDEEGDEQKEETVDETGQDLRPYIAIGKPLVGSPFCDDAGNLKRHSFYPRASSSLGSTCYFVGVVLVVLVVLLVLDVLGKLPHGSKQKYIK